MMSISRSHWGACESEASSTTQAFGLAVELSGTPTKIVRAAQ